MTAACVTPVDDFGMAVAEVVTALAPGSFDWTILGAADVGTTRPDLTVVASAGPAPSLWDRIAGHVADRGGAWMPVVVNHPLLRVGPVSGAGRSGCFHCAEGRRRQHASSPHVLLAAESHRRPDGAAGPPGFLPSTAMIAGGLVGDLLGDDDPGTSAAPSRLVQVDLVANRIVEGRITAIHGCPRCGDGPPETDRSWRRLLRDLELAAPHLTSAHRLEVAP